MRIRVKRLSAALVFVLLTTTITPLRGQNETVKTTITSITENPGDGSLWIGTLDNGVLRISRSGKMLRFSESGGKIPSNNIIGVFFNSQGELLIIDNEGNLTTYSNAGGFRRSSLGTGKISSARKDENSGKIILGGVTKLYTLDTTTGEVDEIAEYDSEPTLIYPSQTDSGVWVISDESIQLLKEGAEALKTGGSGLISNSIPLVFETYTTTIPSDGGGKSWVIWVILSLIVGFIAGFALSKRKKKATAKEIKGQNPVVSKPEIPVQPTPSTKPVVKPEIEPAEKPETTKTVTPAVTKSGGLFTAKVEALVEQNLADKDFDVESIAAILGISRIHVNRKLKAEGAASPSTMIRDKRMAKAKDLLLRGETSVGKIAEICGFRSASYFTTAFKEYTGLTPSEFTAQNQP